MKNVWTQKDFNYLIKNYGVIPTKEIAKTVNRSVNSVHDKARRNGIRIRKERSERFKNECARRYSTIEKHLCWKCKHAVNKPVVVRIVNGKPKMVGKCPWADHLEPVKGWKTEDAGERSISNGANIIKEKFFKVIKCPLYEVG